MVRWLLPWLLVAGCADHGGTTVVLTLPNTTPATADAAHLELFATVAGSAVSIRRLEVRFQVDDQGFETNQKEVIDHFTGEVLGLVDTASLPVLVGGVRFTTPVDLSGATDLFFTVEPDGDTDPTPSRDVRLRCNLKAATRGVLSCVLTAAGDNKPAGTAALILPDDRLSAL